MFIWPICRVAKEVSRVVVLDRVPAIDRGGLFGRSRHAQGVEGRPEWWREAEGAFTIWLFVVTLIARLTRSSFADGHRTSLLPSAQVWSTRRVHQRCVYRRRRLDVPTREGSWNQCVTSSALRAA